MAKRKELETACRRRSGGGAGAGCLVELMTEVERDHGGQAARGVSKKQARLAKLVSMLEIQKLELEQAAVMHGA